MEEGCSKGEGSLAQRQRNSQVGLTLIWKPQSSGRILHWDWLLLRAIDLEAKVHVGSQSHGHQTELEVTGESMRLDSLGYP